MDFNTTNKQMNKYFTDQEILHSKYTHSWELSDFKIHKNLFLDGPSFISCLYTVNFFKFLVIIINIKDVDLIDFG